MYILWGRNRLRIEDHPNGDDGKDLYKMVIGYETLNVF